METLKEIRDRINRSNCKTDKEDSYIRNYENYFSVIRNDEVNFLEIGINEGASLLMWADYFPKGIIVGIDGRQNGSEAFEEAIKDNDYRNRIIPIFSFWTPEHSMELPEREKLFQPIFGERRFDVILDDGAHTYTHTKGSYEVLFHNYLKPGGWYIIEDWGTTYFLDWIDGSETGDKGVARIIKELYDEVAKVDILKGRKDPFAKTAKPEIEFIAIHFGQIWIKKTK